MLAKVDGDGNQLGALWRVEGKDGCKQVERLEAFDPPSRLYRYFIQATAMPVSNYTAAFQVETDGEDASLVVWFTRFDVAYGHEEEGTKTIRQFLRTGLDALRAQYH